MAHDLPLLPTVGVGSYAAPGWFVATWRMARAGELGPHDVDELFEDATRVVIDDQVAAGVDILTDGELRRQRFVYEMFDRLTGLERVKPRRRLGIGGYDMAPHFIARDPVEAPEGLGAVAEFEALKRMAPDVPLKLAIPGPLTFIMGIRPGDGDREALLDRLIGIIHAEFEALAEAGCTYVQLDEPGLTVPDQPLGAADAAEAINRCLDGLEITTAVHVCFGNNAGRPMGDRRLATYRETVERLKCRQLMLEFANREMAEIDMLADLSRTFDIAAGVIDVKNFRIETPEDVAERIRQCLEFAPAEKLTVTADCGFSALPRYIARQKLDAMVAGAAIVRAGLG